MTARGLAGIDHVAITVRNLEESCAFYERLFGVRVLNDHKAVGIRVIIVGGSVRLSVHQAGNGVHLVAAKPTPGAIDICFRWPDSINDAVLHLQSHGIAVVDGPSPRITADGRPAQSIYFRDPDGNLVELLAAD